MQTSNLTGRPLPDCIALALVLAALPLPGCQMRGDVRPASSDIEPPPAFAQTPETCRAAEARFAMGRQISAPLLEEVRQRAGARQARTALPGDAPSIEADATRLTVEIEPTGRIVGARCG
jgi:hypothetical protein